MELWGVTDAGVVRNQNQDVFKILFDEDKAIAVLAVCDGVGGSAAGNVASRLACDTFMKSIGRYVENIGELDDMAQKMADAVIDAGNAVYNKSLARGEYAGMGTTLTAAISTKHGEVIVNIGDSRVYHITDNTVTQITKDHSLVEDMIDQGNLTRQQARIHPNRNLITRVLGTSHGEGPDIFTLKLSDGEYLLLCSDGLSDVIYENEMLRELTSGQSVKKSCEQLLTLAIMRGAPDNVTVVILRK